MMLPVIDYQISRATCRITATSLLCSDDRKKTGTAWLIKVDNTTGYLLTAAHIFGEEEPFLDQAQVQFLDSEKKSARIVERIYDPKNGIDFAILSVEDIIGLKSIPIRFSEFEEVKNKDCTIYGYGKTLYDQSSETGRIYGIDKCSNSSEKVIYKIYSQGIEPGYSGAAIYCDELRAVVALQTSKPDVVAGDPLKYTALALPLYRINEYLNQNKKDFKLYPTVTSFTEFLNTNQELKHKICRSDIAVQINDRLSTKRIINVVGEHGVGKSKFLEYLLTAIPQISQNYYHPLLATISKPYNNEDFFIDFINQLIKSNPLDPPFIFDRNRLIKNWKSGFFSSWGELIENYPNKQFIVIVDEAQVLERNDINIEIRNTFLDFINNPRNGKFILSYLDNTPFTSELRSKGYPYQIRNYDKGTINQVYLQLKNYVNISDDLYKLLVKFGDGHPAILATVVDYFLDELKQPKIEDLEEIKMVLCERVHDQLYAIWDDFSAVEKDIMRYIKEKDEYLNSFYSYYSNRVVKKLISKNQGEVNYSLHNLVRKNWICWTNQSQNSFELEASVFFLSHEYGVFDLNK